MIRTAAGVCPATGKAKRIVQVLFAMSTSSRRSVALTLSDLAPGESAYTSPEALLLAPGRSCCIRIDAPLRSEPVGDATMHVTRTVDGYVADITLCTYRWTPSDVAATMPHAPVVRIVFGDEILRGL